MIHTATLVHDDVLDEATMRRHTSTVNSHWGNQSSVLLGDYLFTHAFYLASTLDNTFACRTIGSATNVVCEGELRQIGNRGNYLLDEAEYLSIIEAKTAELCSCCCRLGAHYSGAEPHAVESLTRYGRSLGIAFQIADDLLDLQGDEATTGKSLGTDLAKQKPTLPLIFTVHRASLSERKQLITLLEQADHGQDVRAEIFSWLARFDALSYAQQKAESFAAQASRELADLPESLAKSVLSRLAEFVVTRAH
jgi:octaprenyl-diphosphate synthase